VWCKGKKLFVSLLWGHMRNIFCLPRNPCNLSRTCKKKLEDLGLIPKLWWQKQYYHSNPTRHGIKWLLNKLYLYANCSCEYLWPI